MIKTNVMRLLENAGIPHGEYEYPVDDGRLDALSIAEKIGEEKDRVFKTMLLDPEAFAAFFRSSDAGPGMTKTK